MHVPSFDDSEFELIFVSMGFWVVASVAPPENQGEAESVEESSLVKADSKFVAVFLSLNEVSLFYFVLDGPVMQPTDEEFILS